MGKLTAHIRAHPGAWGLGGLLLLAFLIRALPAGYGLPYTYYQDEPYAVNRALALAHDRLRPQQYMYPPLFLYLLLVEYGIVYAAGRLAGYFTSAADLAYLYMANKTVFFLLGRITNALIGAATVAAVKHLADTVFDRKVGWVAAVLFVFWPVNIIFSCRALLDVPATLMFTLGTIAILRLLHRRDARDYALAGSAIGLGVLTKYHSVFLVPILILVWLATWWDARRGGENGPGIKLLGVAFLALAATVTVLHPYMIVDWHRAIAECTGSAKWLYGVGEGNRPSGGATGYGAMARAISADVGLPCVAFALVGALGITWGRERQQMLFLAVPAVLFALLAKAANVEIRYVMPLMPLIACLAASGVVTVTDVLGRRRGAHLAWFAVLTALLAYPVFRSVSQVATLLRADTRTVAKEWIEHNLPEGAGVFVEAYGPPLQTERSVALSIVAGSQTAGNVSPESNRSVRYDLWARYAESRFYAAPRRGFRIYRCQAFTGETDPDFRIEPPRDGYWTIAELRAMGIEYYIATSTIYNRYVGSKGKARSRASEAQRAFYQQLAVAATRVADFTPRTDGTDSAASGGRLVKLWESLQDHPGPTIRVYRLPGVPG